MTFELIIEKKKFLVVTEGVRSNHEQDDPNRVLFELTKSEFVDECICEHCCERFENEDSLNQHLREKHPVESIYKCPLCSTISKVNNFFPKLMSERPQKYCLLCISDIHLSHLI